MLLDMIIWQYLMCAIDVGCYCQCASQTKNLVLIIYHNTTVNLSRSQLTTQLPAVTGADGR